MRRILAFAYGVICYTIVLAAFLYLIGFVGDVGVPRTVNTGPRAPRATALLVNGLLLGLFGLRHSGNPKPLLERHPLSISKPSTDAP